MVRAMVHSTKHYVQYSIFTVTGGAVVTKDIAASVAIDAVNLIDEVKEGSSIKAVYIELWARAGSTTPASGQIIIYKAQAAGAAPNASEMAALGDWDNKRNILYTTMGLYNDQDADAIAVFKGWLKIPRGKQRFALGDKLKITFFSPTIDLQICGFATYKEYT